MKVVIAEPIKDELNELIKKNNKDWIVYDDFPKDKAELMERVKDADVACSYFSRFDDEVLSKSQNLKYLAIAAVGAEYSVDMEYASKHGVTVMNCPGYNSTAVAEIAVGLAIDVSRSVSFLNSRMVNGVWANGEQLNKFQISGKKIALIGYGNIGKTIHKLLNSWSQDFKIINSSSSSEEIDDTMAQADFVIVCCALNSNTEGLVSADRIKSMKETAIIVNVARGAIVDEDALFEALKNGTIAGAGLDVYDNEPAVGEIMPENIDRFTKLDNVVCSPHVGAGTQESGVVLSQMIYDNIENCIAGNPQNVYTI